MYSANACCTIPVATEGCSVHSNIAGSRGPHVKVSRQVAVNSSGGINPEPHRKVTIDPTVLSMMGPMKPLKGAVGTGHPSTKSASAQSSTLRC